MTKENEKKLSAFGEQETQYFYSLTPDKILDAVEAFGFTCTGRCMALNSMENRVYDVEIEIEEKHPRCPSDRFRIVKFYRPGRWSKEQILEEHQFLLDLVEYEIPAVAPIVFANGETLLDVPGAGIWCAVFPKVGGRSPDELSPEQIPQVGRLLARMHGVGATRQAPTRLEISPQTFLLDNLDYLQREKVLPPAIENRYEFVVRSAAEITAPWFTQAQSQRIHGDCHLGNLLFGTDGFFWVDFDDMLRGPCVQDMWLLVGGRDAAATEKLDLLVEAYEQMRDFDRSTLRLIEPLRTMRVVHFNTWIAKRWSDPAFPRAFVEYGTERYWQEQLQFLEEQLELIKSPNYPVQT